MNITLKILLIITLIKLKVSLMILPKIQKNSKAYYRMHKVMLMLEYKIKNGFMEIMPITLPKLLLKSCLLIINSELADHSGSKLYWGNILKF